MTSAESTPGVVRSRGPSVVEEFLVWVFGPHLWFMVALVVGGVVIYGGGLGIMVLFDRWDRW